MSMIHACGHQPEEISSETDSEQKTKVWDRPAETKEETVIKKRCPAMRIHP